MHPATQVTTIRLGLRENFWQFSLLVVVNAFVGAMIGLERSILPPLAEHEFQLLAKTAVLSFIVGFGITKAFTNYLAGPKNRGLAMGLNEFAGYFAVAGSALATGYIAAQYGLRPEPFYLGVAFVAAGLLLSSLFVRETIRHVSHESVLHGELAAQDVPSQREIFWRTTLTDRNLSSVSQAGLVNNLNDGMAWGLFPLFFVAAGMNLGQIGTLAAVYPATWGIGQLFTGAWSDRVGRKWLVVSGMWVQAIGIAVVIMAGGFAGFASGGALLGIGTAMVYPTLLAAIGDVAHPSWRASAVGVYRLWRDLGYAFGALLAGLIADALGLPVAMWVVAAITFASGAVVAVRMTETLKCTNPPSGLNRAR